MRAADHSRVPRVPLRPELHQEHDGAEAGDAAELFQVPHPPRPGEREPALHHPHAQAGETPAQVPGPGAGAEAPRRTGRQRSSGRAR